MKLNVRFSDEKWSLLFRTQDHGASDELSGVGFTFHNQWKGYRMQNRDKVWANELQSTYTHGWYQVEQDGAADNVF